MAIQALYQNDHLYLRLMCDSCESPIRKHIDGIFFYHDDGKTPDMPNWVIHKECQENFFSTPEMQEIIEEIGWLELECWWMEVGGYLYLTEWSPQQPMTMYRRIEKSLRAESEATGSKQHLIDSSYRACDRCGRFLESSDLIKKRRSMIPPNAICRISRKLYDEFFGNCKTGEDCMKASDLMVKKLGEEKATQIQLEVSSVLTTVLGYECKDCALLKDNVHHEILGARSIEKR